MTLCFYLSLDYVCNNVGEGAKKISQPKNTQIWFSKKVIFRIKRNISL